MSFLSRYSGNAPSSLQATVNAHLVLVEDFSKSNAMFLPASVLPRMPERFFALRSAERLRR